MSVEIEGREYITAAEYATRYDRHESGLREAARNNRCGLGDATRTIADVNVYPLELVEQWRAEAGARKWVKPRPLTDVTRIARRYDLDRMMVVRALNAKRLVGRQDKAGTWHITDEDAAAWARDWLGIFEPAEDDAVRSSP
jgi:hypothetical protein